MEKIITLSSAKDLRNYVDDHMGGDATPEDIETVTNAIRDDENHPEWGTNWAEYLEAIDLWDLAK